MKRQPYYPKASAQQLVWLANYANKVGAHATELGLDATETIADAKWLIYIMGVWLSNVRSFAQNATAYIAIGQKGLTGGSTWPTPAFVNTTPPAGTVAVAAGAENRIFKFVQNIKDAPDYTVNIGEDLWLIGPPVTNGQPSPTFTLKLGQGESCQCVEVNFQKFTHEGVTIESRRAGEEDFSFLGNDTSRPFVDNRPLLVPGQPEVRAYRLRFWDKGEANGDWSDTGDITVGPS